ncbi:Endogenous retrovirus group FC1 Env polyprotein [Plecturocebus cupreus]
MSTHKKLRYLLTFVDTFSGWIEAFPTSRETADTVASILTQEIIPRFGLPVTIQSDNGPAFMAQVVQLVAKSLNISWKLHIPYHLQSSGKVERAHGILKNHLAKLTIELGSEPPHGNQQALAPLSCCMAGLSWSPIISRYNHLPWPPTFPIYLFSATYSGSTQTALSLLFRGLETHTRQHPCSQVTVFSSGSSNQDLCSPVSPLKASPYYAWQFYLQESWGEGPTTKTQYIAQVDCQPADCKSIKLEFPKSIANTLKRSQNNFGLCFLHDQTKIVCHKWSSTFGGCPYASCVMHKAPKSEMLIIDNQGKVSLTIHDPWHAQWEKGTAGKIYTKYTNSHPSGTWLIYQSYARTVPIEIDQLSSLGNTILQNEATLTNQLKPPSSNSQPFSWLALVQQGVNMLSLTEAINFTNCFLCASLNKPPLAAVPLQTGFNLSPSPMGPDTTLTGVPLFKAHSQNLSLCYETTDNSSCNTTVKVRSTHYAPPGGYFWCNGTLTKVINASLPLPCVPVTLVPQEAEQWATVSLQLLNWRDKLRVAIEASAASLAPSSEKITSLAQVTLQTDGPLDLLTAEKGGTCMFLQEECCYYINESGLVEENINTLHRLQEDLRKKQNTGVFSLSWWHPMLTWLTPVITPIIVICLLLLMAPFLLRFLQTCMREIGRVAVNQMLLHPFVRLSVEAPAN